MTHDTNILWKFQCDINPSHQLQQQTQQQQHLTHQQQHHQHSQSATMSDTANSKKIEQNPDVVLLQNPKNFNMVQDAQHPLNKHHHDCGDLNSRTTAL